jgi:hypothetical protein
MAYYSPFLKFGLEIAQEDGRLIRGTDSIESCGLPGQNPPDVASSLNMSSRLSEYLQNEEKALYPGHSTSISHILSDVSIY